MHSSVEGELVIAKLDDGEDLLKSIDELAVKHRLENAMVMWAIGMLRDLEIGHFNGKAYEKVMSMMMRRMVDTFGAAAISYVLENPGSLTPDEIAELRRMIAKTKAKESRDGEESV